MLIDKEDIIITLYTSVVVCTCFYVKNIEGIILIGIHVFVSTWNYTINRSITEVKPNRMSK